MNYRVGIGYDIHRLAEGYDLHLGGLIIPHHKGTVGHSDGDVLIHSICDALLGAANLRDIGYHFPDSSPDYKDIDSKILLKRTVEMLAENNYSIVNIDSTICLEHPRIGDLVPAMKEILASVMGVDIQKISIKATTSERLGYIGNEEGVAAYAIALIERAGKDA